MASEKPEKAVVLVCDDVRRELGGKLSLMGMFQEMTASSFPAIHPRFYVVIFIYGGRGLCKLSVTIEPPSKKPTAPVWEREIDLQGPAEKHVEVVGLWNISFPEKGMYKVILASGEQTLEFADLEVIQAKD